MKNIITSIELGKLFRSIPLLTLLSISIIAGCKNDKEINPSPDNPVSPTVVSTDPDTDAQAVARNKSIAIDFSKEMNAATINTSTLPYYMEQRKLQGR